MTTTFENKSDIIVYVLEKIISFAKEYQYLFVANCGWWIAAVIGLDTGLTNYIDNLYVRSQVGQREPLPAQNNSIREISSTRRDIGRSVSATSRIVEIQESNKSRGLGDQPFKISKRARKKKHRNRNPPSTK
jgi:hypothetical protein